MYHRGGAAGPAGPVLAGPLFGRIIYSYRASPQLKMRGVATLDDFAHAGACALSNAGARRAIGKCAPQRCYIDDVMVMNIIKRAKISRRASRAIILA